jgi:hypothetical protein
VSASGSLFGRLLIVDHHERPAVEKSRRFAVIRGMSLRYPPFKARRHLVFSACPINSALWPLHRPPSFLAPLPCSSSLPLFFSFINPLFNFLRMPRGGGEDSDGLGDAHPAMWESKLSKADERRIRKECFIPPFVKIQFTERGSGAIVHSDRHEVCVYETMFRTGFRLPFLPMV